MEKKSKKSIIIGISVLLLVTLTLLGLTYAYYRTRIIGNPNDVSISVTSENLEVKYSDDNAVISATEIEPGYKLVKTFQVINTGNETANFSINVDNVNNDFSRKKDWTFKLYEGIYSLEDISTLTQNPISEGIVPGNSVYLKDNISINDGETKNYTIYMEYVELDNIDQSEDMGKTLSLRLNISDIKRSYTFDNAPEGTLLYAINKDNAIVEPLSVPGKSISSSVYSEGELNSTLSNVGLNSTVRYYYFTYGTGYTFDKATGLYSLTGVSTVKYDTSYSTLSSMLSSGQEIYMYYPYPGQALAETEEAAKALPTTGLNKIRKAYSFADNKIEFYTKAVGGVTGYETSFSSAEDDYGTSYYFRGKTQNNYVNFADMCWRIVRVQGDGTIKLLLEDQDQLCNDVEMNGNWYIPVFEPELDANGKRWYDESPDIAGAYSYLIENTTYNTMDESFNNFIENYLDGYISNLKSENWCFTNGEYLKNKNSVSYKCNGTTKNMLVGTITADEATYAGGRYNSVNENYYIMNMNRANPATNFWLFSTDDNSMVYILRNNGNVDLTSMTGSGLHSFRPSIVLNTDISISGGAGTIENPYIVK